VPSLRLDRNSAARDAGRWPGQAGDRDTGAVSRRAALLFAALGVAWGIPYLLIKVAVGELSASQLVLGRTALAAVLLLPLALVRGQVGAVLRRWPAVLAYTVVEIAVPWVFLGRAEQVLPSSTTGLLIAAVPLAGLAVAALTGRPERLGAAGQTGLLLGLLGVAALVGLDVGGSALGPVLEVAVVVLGYAVGPAILSRWLSDLPGLGVVAVSLSLCALLYLPVVLLGGGLPARLPSANVLLSVTALAVVCTAAAFLMLFALIGEIGPVRATTITYVNPAVAVVAGALVLHEPVTATKVVGFALVVLGSVLVTRRSGAALEDVATGRVVPAPADGPCVGSTGEPGPAS
jgi:drug/metabolite transporter (DMT)-like permease